MKVLIVEDEEKTRGFLVRGLTEQGFVVDVAANGIDGVHLGTSAPYDIVLLDVMLPDLDGWSVLSRLRDRGVEAPVLFLTARDAVQDRVMGLELGADDYLVKPFAFSELLARMRARLRRPPVPRLDDIAVADLRVDLRRQRASRGGRLLPLTRKEFLLLSFLVRHRGEVVSRSVIAEQVWDMNFDSNSNVVDVHVRRLRAKLDEPFDQKLIHTVRGSGYVLDDRR